MASDTITIVDDDVDVTLSASPAEVVEQAAAHQITVTARFQGATSVLSAATPVTVTVAPADTNWAGVQTAACPISSSADVCTDQTNNQFTISIPAGDVNASGSFQLQARVDGDNTEDIEYLKLTGATSIGSVAPAQMGVYDPDRQITLSFHQASSGDPALSGITEDGGAQTVRVKATLGGNAASATTVTVNVGAAGGTATLGSTGDYTRGSATATITINSNQADGTADVVLTPRNDGTAEGGGDRPFHRLRYWVSARLRRPVHH